MDHTDRRVKRTQKLLQDALVALTLEKGYDEVTIRDITVRADVGYATFFRHYPDKEGLLADVLQAMKDEFIGLLAPYSIVTDPVKTGTLVFEYVQANSDLCRVLLVSTDTMSLLKPVQQLGLANASLLAAGSSGEGVRPGSRYRSFDDFAGYAHPLVVGSPNALSPRAHGANRCRVDYQPGGWGCDRRGRGQLNPR